MRKSSLIVAAALSLAALSAAAAPVSTSVGIGTYNETYIEYDTDNGGRHFMSEKAKKMVEIAGAVEVALGKGFSVVGKGAYAFGKSDYVGAYSGGNYGDLKINGQDRTRYQVEALVQSTVPAYVTDVKVGAGLGYRSLTDRLDQAGPGGYKRVNEAKYVVFAAESTVPVGAYTVTPAVAYRVLTSGTQHSYVNGTDLTHNQDQGKGYEVSVGIGRKLNNLNIVVSPFYRKWAVDNSNTVVYNGYATREPKNTTTEVGANVSVQF